MTTTLTLTMMILPRRRRPVARFRRPRHHRSKSTMTMTCSSSSSSSCLLVSIHLRRWWRRRWRPGERRDAHSSASSRAKKFFWEESKPLTCVKVVGTASRRSHLLSSTRGRAIARPRPRRTRRSSSRTFAPACVVRVESYTVGQRRQRHARRKILKKIKKKVMELKKSGIIVSSSAVKNIRTEGEGRLRIL